MTLDEMETIAKAAQERNPGPWRRSRWNADVEGDGRFDYIRDSSPKPDGFDDYDGGEWRGRTVLETDGGYYEPKEATATHIATFSPDVVLGLIARVRATEQAVRFLWDGWSDAEGSGQPDTHVFGDDKLDAYLAEIGEPVPVRATPGVQAVVRRLVKP